ISKLDDDSVFLGESFLKNFETFYDSNNPFSFLNLAIFSDARFLKIANDVALDKPLVLQYNYNYEASSFSTTLSFIEVGENSKAEIIVLFKSHNPGEVLANEIINLYLKQNANVEISFVQYDTENLILLNNLNVVTESDVKFKCNTFSLETKFVRNNLNLAFEGLNSLGFLNGINIMSENNFIDNHTVVLHNQPNCTSEEDYRGIINDQARAIFNGKIYVARGAQKTNAYQSNKNILLSNEARVYTRPQLEIYADDVKCTHGATAGFLDQDSLFYMTSRGIGKEKAKSLLLNSFVSSNLEKVEQSELRNLLKELVAKKLNLEDIYFCSAINELSKV
ncbi:MAG: Fe-S cluster assembly protein SufD, partial [Candidatus Kapaibacteriota bacterium]